MVILYRPYAFGTTVFASQDGMLKTVCTELGYRPRLPLEARLQTAVFVGGVGGRCVHQCFGSLTCRSGCGRPVRPEPLLFTFLVLYFLLPFALP